MHTYIFEGKLTLLTSLSHIGETFGINARLRREKIVQPDGTIEDVPIISGNSIRGILRDRGMLHMLKSLGYGIDTTTGEVKGIPLSAFYLLFSGGTLKSGKSDGGIDIDKAREWRNLIPLLSVFGGAVLGQIMPGKLRCGKAIPICHETAHLIPNRFLQPYVPEDLRGKGSISPNDVNLSIWDVVQEEAYTRRDDEKNDLLRGLIEPATPALPTSRAADSERGRRLKQPQTGLVEWDELASASKRSQSPIRANGTEKPKEDVAGETGVKQQMRYFVETLSAGTELFWELSLDDVTPLEFEAFAVTLSEFARFPFLGGKSAIGHGKVSISFDKWLNIDPRLAPTGDEIALPLGNAYVKHLADNAATIRKLIADSNLSG